MTTLSLVAWLAIGPALAEDGRLDTTVRPLSQQIALLMDPGERIYTGTVRIELEVPEKLESFQLHAEEMTIRSARLQRKSRVLEATVAPGEAGLVTVTSAKPLRPGTWTLEIAFENDLNEAPFGLYRFEAGGQSFVTSQLQADDARTAFPCFDEPSFKIPWTLSVEAPEALAVVSNTPVASEVVDGGWKKVTFAQTPPLPSYLVALSVGPYERTPIEDDVPAAIYSIPGTGRYGWFLAQEAPRVLDWQEDWFGTDYPFAKLDWILVPQYPFGAMENPGAIVAQEGLLFFDPATFDPNGQKLAVRIIAHEVAHMWFGDLVTLAWWDDFWLNETFAEWMAQRTLRELHPELDPWSDALDLTHQGLALEGFASTRPLRSTVDPSAVMESVNLLVYPKGQAVLDMLEGWLGAETYQEGVRRYLEAHARGNATAEDLFRTLGEVSGKDVTGMLSPFLDQPGAPFVAIVPGEDGKVAFSQSRFTAWGSEAGEATTWIIPMRVRYADIAGVHEVEVVLDEATEEVELGDGAVRWVLPTANGVGYFVWSLPPDGMKALLADAEELTPTERAAVILDLFRLLQAGTLKAGDVLELLAGFEATDPAVVQKMLPLVDLLEDVTEEASKPALAAWVRQTFRPALERIGMEPRKGESPTTRELRPELLEVLADVGQDTEVRTHLTELGTRFLDDPSAVGHAIAGRAVAFLAEEGDLDLQRRLLDLAKKASDPRLRAIYLNAVGRVPGEEARATALRYALSEEVGLGDMFTVVQGTFSDADETGDEALAWAMAHFQELSERLPDHMLAHLVNFGGGCDLERFEEAKTFFGDPGRAVPGAEQEIREVGEHVRSCVASRELHGPSVEAYLATVEVPEEEPAEEAP